MGTALALVGRKRRKAPAKTAPTVTGSTLAGQASGTTLTVTIPGTSTAGQLGFVVIGCIDTATVTPPAGHTSHILTSMAGIKVHVFLFTVATPGATVNYTLSNNNAVLGIVFTLSTNGGYSVRPTIYQSTSTETLNDRIRRLPSCWGGPDDLLIGISGTYAYVSTGSTAALVTAAPTGWTLVQAGARQNSALTLTRGIAVMTKAGNTGPPPALDYTTTTLVWNIGIVLAIAPANPRWADIERLPTTIPTTSLVHVYGTSSSAYVDIPETAMGYNTRTPWGKHIQDQFSSSGINYSQPGAKVPDINTFIFGTASRPTEAVSGNALSVSRAGTWNPASTAKLVLTDLIGNNIISGDGSTQDKKGVEWGIDAIFRLIRSGTAIAHNNASVTKTGTWSSVSSTGVMFGQCAQTTTPNDLWSLSVTDKDVVEVVLTGGDNTALGNTGATFSILVDGVVAYTGTTHNQMKATGYATYGNYGFQSMVIPITVGSGTHTVAVKHTGSSAHILQVQGALIPKAESSRPWIVSNGLHRSPAAETALGYTWTKQQEYHQILTDVAARFTDGRVIPYFPSASETALWDASTMTCSDNVHQNERGHAYYAHEIMRLINERVA